MREFCVVVCIKQVPDPEAPIDAFEVDSEGQKIVTIGVPPVINPFDENALEAALRIKEKKGGKVIAVSIGEKLAEPVLKKAIAAGADDLILLADPLFRNLDSRSTAYVLSRGIDKIGGYDLILMGRQAGDWDFGVTGVFLSEILKVPLINVVRKIEVKNEGIIAERLCEDGYEVVRASLPVLVTVSSEVGELRYISVKALQAVRKKPVKTFCAGDLELDAQKLSGKRVIELSRCSYARECKFIEGESSREKGENLVLRLRAEGVL